MNELLVDDTVKYCPRGRDFNMWGNETFEPPENRLGRDHCIHRHECSEDE